MQDAIHIMKGKARFEGKCYKVFSRVGLINDVIYINLANEHLEVIKVSTSGWKILSGQDVKFVCKQTMSPLPTPFKNGDINLLWKYINIPNNARKLVIAWLLECLRPDTAFPILVLTGQQGSAKSTTQNMLRNLIDPNISNLRGAPRKHDDIYIAAANNWIVSFNNVSNLTPQNQDDLCCLSTGGGLSTRRLYTTAEEEVIEIKRPVILNGINDIITAQDLIDRCIVIDLPIIEKNSRKTDQELMKDFDTDYSLIFSALVNLLIKVLGELPNVNLKDKPRMADFALLGTALESILNWESGSFMQEYEENQRQSITLAMENSPAIVALIQFMNTRERFTGSFRDLYTSLNSIKSDIGGWPNSPKGLANTLKRQAPALKMAGLIITFQSVRQRDGYHVSITKKSNDKLTENEVHNVHQVHQDSNNKFLPCELSAHSELVQQEVSCINCQNFIPDNVGNGSGIGNCSADAWSVGKPLLYPPILRTCSVYSDKDKNITLTKNGEENEKQEYV